MYQPSKQYSNGGYTRSKQWPFLVFYLTFLTYLHMEPKGRDSGKQIVIFKKVTTCFDVANIIVSDKIFEKPLDFITTRQNIHN